MNQLARNIPLVMVACLTAGCGDSPFYYTPLPRDLEHVSNGGRLGWIGQPSGPDSWTPVYPVEKDWFCNEFAAIEGDVIGLEIVHGERSFVDPPAQKRYFYLDTSNKTAATFDTLQQLENYCIQQGHKTVPPLATRTKYTHR